MMTMIEIFISVDVETAGPIPGEYSLLSIGACLVDDDTKSFSALLKPINKNVDPAALEVTGLSLDRLTQDGEEPSIVMKRFGDWIGSMVGEGEIPVFVGFNAPFDWSFVNYYFHRFAGTNPFGFTALDIKAYYMGATGCSWRDTRSSEISRKLNSIGKGDHDALHDAKFQAELFRLARAKNARDEGCLRDSGLR